MNNYLRKVLGHSKVLSIAGLLGWVALAGQAQAANCSYTINSEWSTGFTGTITIANNGTTAINGWNVGWQYTSNKITSSWNASVSGSNPYTASNLDWNKNISPGQSVSFGFQGDKNGGSAEIPTLTGNVCSNTVTSTSKSTSTSTTSTSSSVASCSKQCNWYGTLYPVCTTTTSGWGYENGKSCVATTTCQTQPAPYGLVNTGQCSSSTTSTSSSVHEYFCGGTIQNTPCTLSSTSTSRTSTSRSTSSDEGMCLNEYMMFTRCSSSSSSSSSSSLPVEPVSNPYTGATTYIDPIWHNKADIEPGGSGISRYHTAIWLDRIAAVTPVDSSFGLVKHLDNALVEKANLITLVLNNLPNRNCHRATLTGELSMDADGINRYKTEFIDPFVDIISRLQYKSLRIVVIIEPDSLVNLVINLADPKCAAAADAGGYKELLSYTLDQLYPLSNVYSYVDVSNAGILGWDTNFSAATTLIADTIKSSAHGVNSVRGFVSNVAGYVPLTEPYLDALANSALPSNSNYQVRQAKFYEWNSQFSELAYAQAWRSKMITLGFPSSIGMLIDTSRNGWGGTGRPTGQSASTDLETFVNSSRVDRRLHRSNWCNQPGGIGERPQANPAPGIHAYLWVKAPGESDGISGIDLSLPVTQTFDRMCDPTYTRAESAGTIGTGAMPNAPEAGNWFSQGFQTLLKNAYPPLP